MVLVAGYTPYYGIETAAGRVGLMTCKRCGALVMIGDEDFDAVKAHNEWHARVELTEIEEG